MIYFLFRLDYNTFTQSVCKKVELTIRFNLSNFCSIPILNSNNLPLTPNSRLLSATLDCSLAHLLVCSPASIRIYSMQVYTFYEYMWFIMLWVMLYTEVFGWCSFLLFWFDFLPLLLSYSLLRMFILCKCAYCICELANV